MIDALFPGISKLDIPLMTGIAVAVWSFRRWIGSENLVLVSFLIGAGFGAYVESTTKEFDLHMALRRTLTYGGGAGLVFAIYRDKFLNGKGA